MFGSSSFRSTGKPAPEQWDPPVGGASAEPAVPQLIAMFGLRACWFESFPFDAQLPRIEPGRIIVPADEPGVASWSGAAAVELPVRYRGLTLGRFVLVPAVPTTGVALAPSARAEALAIAESVGARIAAELGTENDSSPVPVARNPAPPARVRRERT